MSIFISILTLMVLIILHEAGHLIAAKTCGVLVTDFSIGMGPVICQKKFGETNYKISLIPIGGYVAMAGEDGYDNNPRSLSNQPWYKKAYIMFAGVSVNIVTGMILLGLLIFPYDSIVSTTVDEVPASVTSTYSVELGDTFLKVDNFNVYTINDISYGEQLDRDGRLSIELQKENGNIQRVEAIRDRSISLTDVTFVEELGTISNKLKMVINSTMTITQSVEESLKLILSGKVNMNEMSGPIGIVETMSKVESNYSFLYMTAFISINLGCMNLLPIPALDGGQTLLCFWEGITKKRPNEKLITALNAGSFLFLMGLLIAVSLSDIQRLCVNLL